MTDASYNLGGELGTWATATAAEDAAPVAPPRSVADGGVVELAEVTGDTVRAVCRLQVAPEQRGFVAPNAVSFAEALFEPKAWFRAIVADGLPVGFVMVEIGPEGPPFLWRLMVDHRYQGLGYGRRALELLVEHLRAQHRATELLTSWVPGEGGPEDFYLGLGFVPTGEVDDGEVVARLPL